MSLLLVLPVLPLLLLLLLVIPAALAQDAAVFSPLAPIADPPLGAELLEDADTACPGSVAAAGTCCGARAAYAQQLAAANCARVARTQLLLLSGNTSAFARNASNLEAFLASACGNALCEGAKQDFMAALSPLPLASAGCVSAAALAADLQLLCLRSDADAGAAGAGRRRFCLAGLAKLPRGYSATLVAAAQIGADLSSAAALLNDASQGARLLQAPPSPPGAGATGGSAGGGAGGGAGPAGAVVAPPGARTAAGGASFSPQELALLCSGSCAGNVTALLARVAALGAQPGSTANAATLGARDLLAGLAAACSRDPGGGFCLASNAPATVPGGGTATNGLLPQPMPLPLPPGGRRLGAVGTAARALQAVPGGLPGGGLLGPGGTPPLPPTVPVGAGVGAGAGARTLEAALLRSVGSFIGLPSTASPQQLQRGALAADIDPAQACDLCGRVQAAQSTAAVVSRAGAGGGAGAASITVAVNGSLPQARNITRDALLRAAVFEDLNDYVCGALPPAAAFSSGFCGSAVLDVINSARGRSLAGNAAFTLTEAIVEDCAPVLTAAALGASKPFTCPDKCKIRLDAARAGLGCCAGFVQASLIGPIVGLAADSKARGTLRPATAVALDALLSAVNRSGSAALDASFARALSSACGLSLAPCAARTPSTLISRAAGINYAWVTATPDRAAAFSTAFVADLAAALFVPSRMLNVTGLASGSVIVSILAGGASTAFSANLVRSAAQVLNSPAFAFTSVLTMIEPFRADALSGVITSGIGGGSGGGNGGGSIDGSAAGGGTIGGSVDLGNASATAPSSTTTTTTLASADTPSAGADATDAAAAQSAMATNIVVGVIVGIAALLGAAFIVRCRSRRPTLPRPAIAAANGQGALSSARGTVVENPFSVHGPAAAGAGGPIVFGAPRSRIVFAPTPETS
jgi:hypothetical protein